MLYVNIPLGGKGMGMHGTEVKCACKKKLLSQFHGPIDWTPCFWLDSTICSRGKDPYVPASEHASLLSNNNRKLPIILLTEAEEFKKENDCVPFIDSTILVHIPLHLRIGRPKSDDQQNRFFTNGSFSGCGLSMTILSGVACWSYRSKALTKPCKTNKGR